MDFLRAAALTGLAAIALTNTRCAAYRLAGQYAQGFSRHAENNFDARVNRDLRQSYIRDVVDYNRQADSFFQHALRFRLETDPQFREELEHEIKSLLSRSARDAADEELKKSELYRSIRRIFDIGQRRKDPTAKPNEDKYRLSPHDPSVLEPEKRKSIGDIMAFIKEHVTDVRVSVSIRNLTEGKPEPEFSFRWMRLYKVTWKPRDEEFDHSISATLGRTSIGLYFRHNEDGTARDMGIGIGYLANRNFSLGLSAGHSFDEARTSGHHTWDEGNSFMLEGFLRY